MKEYIIKEHPDFPYEEPKPQELIRCKDCARWATEDGKTGKCSELSEVLPSHATVADFFCGMAERKETK